MTVVEIFTALDTAGITLRLTGPNSFAASPKEAITPELAAALVRHRWGVLAVLMLKDVWARREVLDRPPGGRGFRRVN